MPSFLKKFILAAGIGLWLAAAAWGMKWMSDYSLIPGTTGAPARDWPTTTWSQPANRFTMVVALHPECPCSRATLAELDSVLLQAGDAVEAVLIFSDDSPGQPAKDSALYRQATALPRTRLLCDVSGAELKRFAFLTSGETRLYRADGQLVFRGGITGSRGHVGDNPGRNALLAAMRPGADERPPAVSPVFGCALTGE